MIRGKPVTLPGNQHANTTIVQILRESSKLGDMYNAQLLISLIITVIYDTRFNSQA